MSSCTRVSGGEKVSSYAPTSDSDEVSSHAQTSGSGEARGYAATSGGEVCSHVSALRGDEVSNHASTSSDDGSAASLTGLSVRAIAFTDHGMQTGERIRAVVPQMQLTRCPKGGLAEWTAGSFESADVIIYIGAAGIAVRAIAPHIVSKLRDPAVLVTDELGRYVIPILSGHVGGANAAAEQIADALGATAVITTATDLNHRFAIDVWAVRQGLTILNKDGIKTISSRILAEKPVYIYSRWDIGGELPDGVQMTRDPARAHAIISYRDEKPRTSGGRALYQTSGDTTDTIADGISTDTECAGGTAANTGGIVPSTGKTDENISSGAHVGEITAEHAVSPASTGAENSLRLTPRCLYIGIGCRRGTPHETIEAAWARIAGTYGLYAEAVAGVTSIDIKADEPGLLEFCKAHGWMLTTYTADELNAVEGDFHGSDFVKKTVGVDSVCERSCVLAAQHVAHASLLVPKTAADGVTVAVALAPPRLSIKFDCHKPLA